MKYFKYSFYTFLFFIITSSSVFGQEHSGCSDDELKAEVPELFEFHDVIYKIWHNAWPEKDTEMLIELLPEVEEGSEKVINAELPGILRDKKQKWQDNIDELKIIVNEYRNATKENDKQKLLDAAEKLHSQFEKLVRIIRPVIKEIEDFHVVLYKLYHYYMPEEDHAKIKSSIIELKKQMDILNKAKLPERRKSKEKDFIAAREKLSKSVNELVKALKKYNIKTIKQKIEIMHTNYQSLEKVFD